MQTQPLQTSTDAGNATHSNGNRGVVRLARSRKGRTRIRLLYPSHNTELDKRASRLALRNGRYFNRRLELDVALDPGMDWNGGGTIYIDGDRGIQTTYAGPHGWLGIDGRYGYAADHRKDAKDLRTRGMQLDKYLWPAVALVLGTFGAMIALVVLTQG